MRDSIRAGAAKRPSNPGRVGYHPLRSDGQPCAHATTPPSNGVITSQDYEPKFDNYDSFAADDFVIPVHQVWIITEVDVIGESSEPPVPPDSFHVFFYADSGTLPGTLVASRLANPYSGFFTFEITLTSPVMLPEGTYWVSVQAREDFTSSGEWFWGNRLVISNSGAAWQNPGGGFGANCPAWGRKTTCRPTQNGPDQLFRLIGSVIFGDPTPTQPPPTPTTTATFTPTPTATATATSTATATATFTLRNSNSNTYVNAPPYAEDYANAQAASDAAAAPVVQLENVKAGARERPRGLFLASAIKNAAHHPAYPRTQVWWPRLSRSPFCEHGIW